MKLKFWNKDQAQVPLQEVDEPRPDDAIGVVIPANTLVHLGENGEILLYEWVQTPLDIRYNVVFDAEGNAWANVDDLVASYEAMRDGFVAGGSLPELVNLADALISAFLEYEAVECEPVNFGSLVPSVEPEPVDERAWIGPLF